MSSYLVTFCNTGRAGFALVGSAGVQRVFAEPIPGLDLPVFGTVGATFHAGRCFVALQGDAAAVAVYREDWSLERVIEPAEVKDIHGLAGLGDELLIVSTGTNQIVACDLGTGRVRSFWSDPAAGVDTVHVNDVAVAGSRVLASRFGPRQADGLRRGAVFDAATGTVLLDNLREPHSVALDAEGALHVLESPSGDLVRCRPGFTPKRLLGLLGYARGLAIGPEAIAIGKSGYRQQSRSGLGETRLAPLAPNAAALEASASSGLFVVSLADGNVGFVDTSALGAEIYAVVACPWPAARPDQGRRTRRRGGSTAAGAA